MKNYRNDLPLPAPQPNQLLLIKENGKKMPATLYLPVEELLPNSNRQGHPDYGKSKLIWQKHYVNVRNYFIQKYREGDIPKNEKKVKVFWAIEEIDLS